MIRISLFALLALAALPGLAAHHRHVNVEFAKAQRGCVETGAITLGPRGRWAECQITRRDWVATIGLLDFYQYQYCLGGSPGHCERRALLIFSNRAYNPSARLVLQRIDPGATQYDDPLVVETRQGTVLVISGQAPGGAGIRQHYLWQGSRWTPVMAGPWLNAESQ
jgi:hypothetical protein